MKRAKGKVIVYNEMYSVLPPQYLPCFTTWSTHPAVNVPSLAIINRLLVFHQAAKTIYSGRQALIHQPIMIEYVPSAAAEQPWNKHNDALRMSGVCDTISPTLSRPLGTTTSAWSSL